uniref:caspase recruitment domain-containing protein 8-like n=1 Tax=Semicossyphus pulcher TaxID=241346 RepID=UPI0037E81963
MASKDFKQALVDTLVDLRPSEFRRFSDQVKRRIEEHTGVFFCKGAGNLPACIDIADLLISKFTEGGALPEAVKILGKIGCHNAAYRVKQASGQAIMLPDPREEEHLVDKYKVQLINCVSDVESILNELLTKKVIPQERYDTIRALPTPEEKMTDIFDCLTAVGDRGKDILYNIIDELEPHLFDDFIARTEFSDVPHRMVSLSQYDRRREKNVRFRNCWISAELVYWSKLEPEVISKDAPIYSLQSEAGTFECGVSGLRWICEEKISFQYRFGSWEEHMERLETLHYIPGGPLLDIKVIAGKFDQVYLPHWICTEDNPSIVHKFAVIHMDSCGDVVEQASEVTPSHVKLSDASFSPRGVLMRAGFPVKIRCKVLIYKTSKAFLTLHVYVIPRDPALQQAIKNKELSSGYKLIQKPYPEKSLKMGDRFTLTVDEDAAEVNPEKLKLVCDSSDPNFFEVFTENPVRNFRLTLENKSEFEVWSCKIRKNDYQNTGVFEGMYDKELARVRPKLVQSMSRELINQLLDDLLVDGVLNDGERDSILQENKSCVDKARCLIDSVKRKGCEASRKLFHHLQHRDPTLSKELGLPSGLPV